MQQNAEYSRGRLLVGRGALNAQIGQFCVAIGPVRVLGFELAGTGGLRWLHRFGRVVSGLWGRSIRGTPTLVSTCSFADHRAHSFLDGRDGDVFVLGGARAGFQAGDVGQGLVFGAVRPYRSADRRGCAARRAATRRRRGREPPRPRWLPDRGPPGPGNEPGGCGGQPGQGCPGGRAGGDRAVHPGKTRDVRAGVAHGASRKGGINVMSMSARPVTPMCEVPGRMANWGAWAPGRRALLLLVAGTSLPRVRL
jgi:hypothetical protein